MAHSRRTFDRAFWDRRLNDANHGNLQIPNIIYELGLKQSGDVHKLLPFGNDHVRKFAEGIAFHAKSMRFAADPQRLVDIATDPDSFVVEAAQSLLDEFGPLIWSEASPRSWLLHGAPRYSQKKDRALLKKNIQLWIIVLAFNAYNKEKKAGELIETDTSLKTSTTPSNRRPNVGNYDRVSWTRKFEDSGCPPTIDSIVASLGLEPYYTANNGIKSFASPDVQELEQYISGFASTLPQDKDALLDIATAPDQLTTQADKLLRQFGEKLWGEDHLAWPQSSSSEGKGTRKLVYENVLDQDVKQGPVQEEVGPMAIYEDSSDHEMLNNDHALEHDDAMFVQDEHAESADEQPSAFIVAPTTGHPRLSERMSTAAKGKKRDNGRGFLLKIETSSDTSSTSAATDEAESGGRAHANPNVITTYNDTTLSGTEEPTSTRYLERNHEDVLHGSIEGVAQAPDPRPDTRRNNNKQPLPHTGHWGEHFWRRFVNSAMVTLTTMMTRLGFTFYGMHNKHVTVHHPVGQKLLGEVYTIASLLYAQLSTNQLVRAAADYSFLTEDIDLLLDEYAPSIWGVDADRAQLLQAGVDELYPKDLVYEDVEDRELLRLYIHEWIFVRAFRNLQRCGDTAQARAAVLSELDQNPNSFAGSVVPRRIYAAAQLEVGSQPNSPEASRPREKPSRKRAAPESTNDEPAQRLSKKQKPQEQLTVAMLNYLENKDDSLEDQLIDDLDKSLGTVRVWPELQWKIMNAWVRLRRDIHLIKRRASELSESIHDKTAVNIERSNLLQKLRAAWEQYNKEVSLPAIKELKTYAMFLGYKGLLRDQEDKESNDVIKAGIERLHEEFLDLASDLGNLRFVLIGVGLDQ